MDFFINSVRSVSRICGVVAGGLVAAAVLVVCEMVVLRYFLNASTIWQTEFVTFSLVGATFIGSPYVLLVKGHVNVDLVPIWMKHASRRYLAIFAYGIALVFSAIVAWTGFELLHEAWTGGWRTDTVWSLPLWIPYLAMPIGIGVLTLQYIVDILAVATGRDEPFGLDSGDEA